jgi:hypothetical protein
MCSETIFSPNYNLYGRQIFEVVIFMSIRLDRLLNILNIPGDWMMHFHLIAVSLNYYFFHEYER